MKHLIVLTALLLGGCVSAPTSEEMTSADYGPPPKDYEATVREYLSHTLKDPYSYDLKFLFEPRKDWSGLGARKQFGYAVCANVNAKNSFGAYTGFKLTYFLIRNDQVVASVGGTGAPQENISAQQQCNPDKRA